VSKTCPGCGYGPIGPFTDNCPICAEPVRYVRSDGPRGGQPVGVLPAIKWMLVGVLVAGLAVVGCCGFGIWRGGGVVVQNGGDGADDRRSRGAAVAAADLLEEFRTDPAVANRKYRGKRLEITGAVVDRTGRDGGSTPFVVLHAGDENIRIKIECFFDASDDEEEAAVLALPKGTTVTIRGDYTGRVSHVQIRECSLVK
jgi:hypothetical protein